MEQPSTEAGLRLVGKYPPSPVNIAYVLNPVDANHELPGFANIYTARHGPVEFLKHSNQLFINRISDHLRGSLPYILTMHFFKTCALTLAVATMGSAQAINPSQRLTDILTDLVSRWEDASTSAGDISASSIDDPVRVCLLLERRDGSILSSIC
jgi:hypothetical protein